MARIAVLLAAYNGERWLVEQIESILFQRSVCVDLYVSLDLSTDQSFFLIEKLKSSHPNIKLLPYGERFGGAAVNFYRLIRDVQTDVYDYVAFSDQDDIWLDYRLSRALEVFENSDAVAYSSDVLAFWDDGTKKKLKKSFRQRKFDYIFEGAGPGCTYVFKASLFGDFSKFVQENIDIIGGFKSHDWLAYAFVRSRGLRWIIDDYPGVLYRQHNQNEFGANLTAKSYFKRLSLIFSGWYQSQIRILCDSIGIAVVTPKFILYNWCQTRRRLRDCFLLVILCLWI